MIFNSLAFVVFALVFFGAWPAVRRFANARYLYIIAFSFLFYGWWDWRYIVLMVLTAMVDFWAGIAIVDYPKRRKAVLVLSLTSNLVVLGFFKYTGFFISNLNVVSSTFGMPALPVITLLLPVGISFYTFQSMSYTIDIYQGKTLPTRNPLHFLSAVAMFPHLVAGPIMRASYLLPQLLDGRSATREERWEGMRLIVHGYFKKMVIADNLAAAVNDAFNASAGGGSMTWWLVTVMFAFQIYCDFSGYSDIARGLAKWMGYDFSLNFRHPYCSTSMTEFWKRWHISLSSWFRDYVYVPLGGARKGALRGHINMWIAMLLSGLWHGAAWTFVIWGALHAFYLSVERVTKWPERIMGFPFGRPLAAALIFVQVCVAWVFFRASSLDQAFLILRSMFALNGEPLLVPKNPLVFLAIGVAREIYCFLGMDWRKAFNAAFVAIAEPAILGLLIAACIYLRGPGNTFIYFQF